MSNKNYQDQVTRTLLILLLILALPITKANGQPDFSNWGKQSMKAPETKYRPGEAFPKGGYKMSCTYGDLYVKKFADNDSLYYLQWPLRQYNDGRAYYFVIMNKSTTYTLLNHGLNKDDYKLAERYAWLNEFMKELKSDKVGRPGTPWTKFRPRLNGERRDSHIYGSGYFPLTYKKAITAYRQDRGGGFGSEILCALILMNWMSGSGNSDGKYYCSGCGASFNDYAVMRSHENAVHDF